MAAAAFAPETQINTHPEILGSGFERTWAEIQALPETGFEEPAVINVAEMPGDSEMTEQARRHLQTRLVAESVASSIIETRRKPIKNIHEALLWAQEGDPEGRAMVKANVGTDAAERVFKVGAFESVMQKVDANGDIFQHGQRTEDIQLNAERFASHNPIIRPRTDAEGNNRARIKNLYSRGYLKDHYLVVFSMCPEGVDDETLDKLNFFSLTKSISVQATTEVAGGLQTEPAFVAGVADEHSDRHDRAMVEKTAEMLGVDYKGKSVSEIINMPLLIHKDFMPNGVIDVVKWMDTVKGTFFGQNNPTQNYVKFRELCLKRQAGLDQNVEQITDELISMAHMFEDAKHASAYMSKLNGIRMVERALQDTSIDARVFGSTAASYIEEGRYMQAQGMYEQAMGQMLMAQMTETSGSCPSSLNPTSMLSLESMQGYLLAGMADAIIMLNGWQAEIKTSKSDIMKCVNCPSCGTFHDEVKKAKDGKWHCDNKGCKLH